MKPKYEYKIYDVGKCRYRGVYLNGVYTREMAEATQREAAEIIAFFDHADRALKRSMKEVKK